MSLDVYLTIEGAQSKIGSGIFIREDGSVKEVTRAEWDEKYPDREPCIVKREDTTEVYSANITHNLNAMAREAGVYRHLWRPDEIGIEKASQLIRPLRVGLELLCNDPEKFKEHNPENGWGNYEGLVSFVEEYLEACEEYPTAKVETRR